MPEDLGVAQLHGEAGGASDLEPAPARDVLVLRAASFCSVRTPTREPLRAYEIVDEDPRPRLPHTAWAEAVRDGDGRKVG